MVISARTIFDKSIIREIMIIACWVIWKTRNGIIFDRETHSLSRRKTTFKEELGLVYIKAKHARKVELELWRENFS